MKSGFLSFLAQLLWFGMYVFICIYLNGSTMEDADKEFNVVFFVPLYFLFLIFYPDSYHERYGDCGMLLFFVSISLIVAFLLPLKWYITIPILVIGFVLPHIRKTRNTRIIDRSKDGDIFIVDNGGYNQMYMAIKDKKWSYDLLMIDDIRSRKHGYDVHNSNKWGFHIIGILPKRALVENGLMEDDKHYCNFYRYDTPISVSYYDKDNRIVDVVIKNAILGKELEKNRYYD